MSGAYYNEHDAFAAAWLRELISDGLIAPGDVDERDIQQVRADDLREYTQCHFFAGIGGWSYALRLAGWPDEQPVWTGSCPCQPLSSAGQRKGHADERHLWPAFYSLIAECRPAIVFGEQVAGALGYEWLAGIRADLEGDRYAVGAADLCAPGVGAPHIRARLYWLADADGWISRNRHLQPGGQHGQQPQDSAARDGMAHAGCGRIQRGGRPGTSSGAPEPHHDAGHRCADVRLDDAAGNGRRKDGRHVDSPARIGEGVGHAAGSGSGFWSAAELIGCSDGKARRVEPGIFPLAHGVPNRMGTLRGAGNAIVPQVAAEFIGAYVSMSPREGG